MEVWTLSVWTISPDDRIDHHNSRKITNNLSYSRPTSYTHIRVHIPTPPRLPFNLDLDLDPGDFDPPSLSVNAVIFNPASSGARRTILPIQPSYRNARFPPPPPPSIQVLDVYSPFSFRYCFCVACDLMCLYHISRARWGG